MSSFSLELPTDFEDYEWTLESKGWFSEARIVVTERRYQINFYDLARFTQTVEGEFERGQIFFEPNLVIVPSVTRAHMERAAEELVQSGQILSLVAE
ncbi:hypothetical protein [Bradyrhizobium sp. 170]|uniref:hypothetical protein n=1 Tax=Bradyrhizobium sp. 170 TaxID=2782641 RepID=UPI001FFEA3CD|nr:hypothetical protein [Bradyrhizobium sp. 170]UPK05137.1 hypothetical protein IVB05_05270 [Bradyrhizobium sp. 170]